MKLGCKLSINQSFWGIESSFSTLQKVHLTLGKFEKRDFIIFKKEILRLNVQFGTVANTCSQRE